MILIVGAGLSGCVLAERYAKKGKIVRVIEKRSHIGGNCYDYTDEAGILISKYGPHFFHTKSEVVWEYICQFCEWFDYEYKIVGRGKGKTFPVPINIETVNTLYGVNLMSGEEMRTFLETKCIVNDAPKNSKELALSRFGKELYEVIIEGYTMKQWEKNPSELDPSVVGRIPIRYSFDDRYFSDPHQVLPVKGYTHFCEKMLEHPNITVECNVEFLGDIEGYEKIFYTGPIDSYFTGHDALEYRSLRFEIETLEQEFYQSHIAINYTDREVPYTRIVEYKHLRKDVCKNTTIVKEYPSAVGEPYYPVPSPRNLELYAMYKELADKEEREKNVYFVGRLANYKYFNMDEAILNALELFKKIEGNA